MSTSAPLKILLVDDDKNIRQMLTVTLQGLGHEVISAESVTSAEKHLRKGRFDLMLTDFRLGAATGIDLLKFSKSLEEPPVVVLMTAFASFENAVNAVQEGAFDYLPKPFSNAQLAHVLKKAKTVIDLRHENARLKKGGERPDFFVGMTSSAMLRLQEFIGRVAPTDSTVLLTGESGTGKSELARLIHARSPRSPQPLTVVNCATLTENLLESELFGHVRGAFTGATQDHAGKLEIANRGTVFIDEIGDLSVAAQTRLLRFLQDRVIERVGSHRPISLDVRVIAATNRNLEEAVKTGSFREDLYFRLNVFECTLVPLRFRKDDLPVLIQRFSREFATRAGLSAPNPISEKVMKALLDYHWPGNIRELRNVIERFSVLAAGREASLEDLPDALKRPPIANAGHSGTLQTLEELERAHIEKVLSIESNQERAAEILGITTVTLWRKRKQYGLP